MISLRMFSHQSEMYGWPTLPLFHGFSLTCNLGHLRPFEHRRCLLEDAYTCNPWKISSAFFVQATAHGFDA